jgi:hypothetical protein
MQQAPELGLELPSRRARPPSPGRGGRSPAARARARRARRRAVHAAARRMQPGAGRLAARGGARLPPCRPRARPPPPAAARAAAVLAAPHSAAAVARRSAAHPSRTAAPFIASADPPGARVARRPSEGASTHTPSCSAPHPMQVHAAPTRMRPARPPRACQACQAALCSAGRPATLGRGRRARPGKPQGCLCAAARHTQACAR